jgi:hypothetical protein
MPKQPYDVNDYIVNLMRCCKFVNYKESAYKQFRRYLALPTTSLYRNISTDFAKKQIPLFLSPKKR